jgi:hypothetical protein
MSKISHGFLTPFTLQLSFHHVIAQLSLETTPMKLELLERARAVPELSDGIYDSEVLTKHEKLISELLEPYFPVALTHNEIKAVGLPFQIQVFNLSSRFQSILEQAGKRFEFNIRDFDTHQLYVMSCSIVMNKIYGTQLDFGKPLFYDIPTSQGIIKHYRILYNADFLEVIPTEKAIPLTGGDIELLMDNYDDLDLWMRLFPIGSYVLKGFSIMTLFDVTVENAVSTFKGNLLDFNPAQFKENLDSIFSSIFRIADLRVGYVLVSPGEAGAGQVDEIDSTQSILVTTCSIKTDSPRFWKEYLSLVNGVKYYCSSNISRQLLTTPDNAILSKFAAIHCGSLILAPVISSGRLLGILEIASPRITELNSINANRLDVVMSHFTDKLDKLAAEVENNIQAHIQSTFTSLHPSVNWKFRTLARQQLNFNGASRNRLYAQDIIFEHLVPMYGQTDVKGSSEVRNRSAQLDLAFQLKRVLNLLQYLYSTNENLEISKLIAPIENLLVTLNNGFEVSTEQLITGYLKTVVHPVLREYCRGTTKKRVERYFGAAEDKLGAFHQHRRKYDLTISRINEELASLLEQQQQSAQQIFPHYYEQFKTDGIEHTLYLGQSVAPWLTYHDGILDAMRLWQLKTVCEMGIAHQKVYKQLPFPLLVTSLILVYNTEIAIRFRMDEKRFDVDGTYNARFEMVKKRIDKATIKNSGERITQPGKIAIVFTGEHERERYLQYVRILQQKKMLAPKVELYDIEDLQGLVGLKGLSVKIRYKFSEEG